PAGGIGHDGLNGAALQPPISGRTMELAGRKAQQPAFGAYQPQAAVTRFGIRLDKPGNRAAVRRTEDLDLAAGVTSQQPVLRANPKGATPIFKKRKHTAPGQSSRPAGIENFEPRAIETRQATESAQPKITVAGLGNHEHRTLPQPIIDAPA